MKFKVTQPIDYGSNAKDRKRYEPGSIIELREEDVRPLQNAKAIEPIENAEDKAKK